MEVPEVGRFLKGWGAKVDEGPRGSWEEQNGPDSQADPRLAA
jgi:hypothetical protein